MRPLEIAIIGCGTAGSAAAIFLARTGHRVTIYERVPEPAPVGAGITLQPTGLHVLHRLGLHAHVVSRGARIDRLYGENKSGKVINDLSYATVDPKLFGLGIHRGALFEALSGALQKERIELRLGMEIVDLSRELGRRWLVDVHRERHGPYDFVVVVADGARSQLRDDTSTSKRVAPYPWGALWFVGCGTGRDRTLFQVLHGCHQFVGLLPTGLGPTGGGEPLVSLFWSLRSDALPAWRARGLEPWKSDVRALCPETAPVLDQIHSQEQVLMASYHDVVMHRWSTRNVAYLGDAAHATSPQLGQGANLALWDAMTLSDSLGEVDRDLAHALDRYSRTRREHLAFYQLATRWLTPFFQSDSALFATLRDTFMPVCAKLPFTKKLMTTSMIGVMNGFAGNTLPLDLP